MTDYIHGSSDEREVARLEKQAQFAAPFILERFDAAPGMKVLDLATGVGAMAGQLLRRYPGITLFGAELRRSQLRHAQSNHPGVHYVQANGASLPFRSETFDRVHCSWLLEHVPSPVPILEEVRRVLRPGGYCQFIEVDNESFSVTPVNEDVDAVMRALNEAQVRSGGDPFVGQRLGSLMHAAGFSRVETRDAPIEASSNNLAWLQASVDEFAEIFESLDEALGPTETARIQRASSALRALVREPAAQFRYRSVVGVGYR